MIYPWRVPDRGFKSRPPQPLLGSAMAWVYVVQNAEGRFYVGMTTDLEGYVMQALSMQASCCLQGANEAYLCHGGQSFQAFWRSKEIQRAD